MGSQNWTVLHSLDITLNTFVLFRDSGLIAGDMVAGIGTILIPPGQGDMMTYIVQLERLLDLDPHLIFPSHGPVIPLPSRTLRTLYLDIAQFAMTRFSMLLKKVILN